MKFKTRLIITFLTIILLPLVLACTAFLGIGAVLSRGQEEFGIQNNDYNVMIDPTLASQMMTDEIFAKVTDILDQDPARIEDSVLLDEINSGIAYKSSYILVRRGKVFIMRAMAL